MRVLQFSGGRDSLACLHYMRAEWDDITVYWMNTGDAYPETIAQMKEIAALVPHFIEGRADVLKDIVENGLPTDVVPMNLTPIGKWLTDSYGTKVRAQFECCKVNMWMPIYNDMLRMGATEIIRGQLTAEKYKSPMRDGDVENGIVYRFPIQNWTKDDVDAFLNRIGVPIPSFYETSKTSLDCMHCTAYLDARVGQFEYLRKQYPKEYVSVIANIRRIRKDIAGELVAMDEVLERAEGVSHG